MDGSVDGGDSDTLRPGTTLGRYEVRRLLGRGGMGCVYEAIHRDLKKRVAIKTLLPALASSSDAKQRFLREGEAASRIRHPHVVDVTDLGSEGSVIYLVMEYLEGEDLARSLARQGFLSPLEAADIMLPVAAAIATAHEQGVIHRDLKPENIFLARTAYGAIQPKVLDFGISKVLGDSRARALTGTAATMGTMHYLPPEQLRAAREADARSDQYGLGVIAYECVTGQRAFEEESFYILIKKIAEGEYVRPSVQRPGLPERMEAIIMRAMSLDPLARFDSVKQFGAALLEFAGETTRILWEPFFGAAPMVPARAITGPAPATLIAPPGKNPTDPTIEIDRERPRVATLLEPEAKPPAAAAPVPSATMELPAPPRKAASTTLRNATGERAIGRAARPGRWRAPAIVVGFALASVVTGLVIVRGRGADERRGDPGAPASESVPAAASGPGATTAPADETRPAAAAPRRAPAAETAPPPAPAPATTPAPERKSVEAIAAPAADGTRPRQRAVRKNGAKNGRVKKEPPAASEQIASPATTTATDTPKKTANDAPVIAP